MHAIAAVRQLWARHRAYRKVLAELGAYSDLDLADLGIGPADVGRLAREEASRRLAAARGRRGPARRPSPRAAGFSFVGSR